MCNQITTSESFEKFNSSPNSENNLDLDKTQLKLFPYFTSIPAMQFVVNVIGYKLRWYKSGFLTYLTYRSRTPRTKMFRT